MATLLWLAQSDSQIFKGKAVSRQTVVVATRHSHACADPWNNYTVGTR
jgi:hypothetical protein